MNQPSVTIRRATNADVPAITGIYNEAILNTDATFDNETKTAAEQEIWFKRHDAKHPVLVAVHDSEVVGWASLSEWSSRCAYAGTAELSVYIGAEHRNRGIGKRLMEETLSAGRQCGLHTVLSRVTEGNASSIHLHLLAGFENVGTMREVGFKFNRLLDVRIMQKIYPP
jgi:L-amino acid N-acyltransferase